MYSLVITQIGAPGYLHKVTDGSLIRYMALFGVPLGVGLFFLSTGMLNLFNKGNTVFGISFFLFMFPNLLVNDWIISKSFGLIFAMLFLDNLQNKNLRIHCPRVFSKPDGEKT